jgi:hypothetical protein
LDGIRDSGRKDRFRLAQMLCPQGHDLTRHRRRDYRHQYYCSGCDSYYTENAGRITIKNQPGHFDALIKDYIKECLENKKPNISKLCIKHKLSRASTYRHLFDGDKKLIIDALLFLHRWAKVTFLGLYKRSIHDQTLKLKHHSPRKDFELTLTPEISLSDHILYVKGEFNKSVAFLVSGQTSLVFDKSGKNFILPLNLEKPASDQLTSVTKILKYYE